MRIKTFKFHLEYKIDNRPFVVKTYSQISQYFWYLQSEGQFLIGNENLLCGNRIESKIELELFGIIFN